MAGRSRRSFLATGGVIPFALWLESCEKEKPRGPFIRYEAYTTEGKAMLVKYAAAVNQMKTTTPVGSPISWIFQWYTHAVRPDKTKASEIAAIYPGTTPDPHRDLAQDVWNTCEPHFSGDEEYFVPWHRMFVYFFERIIRKTSGDPRFTLPYWNYSTSGTNHGVIPPEFQQTTSSLFQANRNPGVNTGQPIDQGSPGDLNLDALQQTSYLPVGAAPGFNQDLDLGLHGNVHVDTGDPTNMGSVPWAAEDAVFWMHHCNIDRLWASWNKNGGLNPTNQSSWMDKQFIFADENGLKVTATIKDFKEIAALDYTYDSFEPAPPGFTPSPLAVEKITLTNVLGSALTMTAHVGSVGAAELRVTLKPSGKPVKNQFDKLVETSTEGRKIYLVLNNLQAKAQPGVMYDVFLNLPAGAAASARNEYRVGSVNFFDSVSHWDHAAMSRFRSFDVTSFVKTQRKAVPLGANPVVSIIPRGTPAVGAETVVGDVAIVRQ